MQAIPTTTNRLGNILQTSFPTRIVAFGRSVPPWLLQTPSFAREVISGGSMSLTQAEVAARLEPRMALKALVLGRIPVEIIIDEALSATDPRALASILEHLGTSQLTLQLLPLQDTPQRRNGDFMVVSFRHSPPVLLYDTFEESMIETRTANVSRALALFRVLSEAAHDPDTSAKYLQAAATG